MLYLIALIGALLSAGITYGAVTFGKKVLAGSKGSARKEKEQKIAQITSQLSGLSRFLDGYASPLQLKSVDNQLNELKESFAAQKKQLAETEALLATAQKNVEVKETQQQELKTLKEEDESKLVELLTKYETLSEEAVALEQQLANAMKNLEELLSTATLTDIEKDLLKQLNEAVISASGRLRDLMTEYGVVKERLETIQGQFKDLEEEYTRLVEQQLGV
jgi:chromosome segregation ATPase